MSRTDGDAEATLTGAASELDDRFDSALRELPAVAILRAASDTHLVAAAQVLVEAGFRAVEFPLTTPGALAVVEETAGRLGDDVVIGAGTVLDGDDARRAVDAGAELLVSPALCAGALRYGRDRGIPMLPGVYTPSEAMEAVAQGARLVKLFPAETVGPTYLSALLDPFPRLRVVPTGGVRLDDVPGWLAAGAAALGVGAPMHGDTLDTGELGALRVSAQRWVTAIREAASLREVAGA